MLRHRAAAAASGSRTMWGQGQVGADPPTPQRISQNLCTVYKKTPHKTLRVHSARYTQCIIVKNSEARTKNIYKNEPLKYS